MRGRLTLTVLGPGGELVDQREGLNVVCTTGYTAIAAALVWSGIQDQAANLGVPSPTYLAPIYGAVGTGVGTPTKADTKLFSEVAREFVGAGASSPASPSIASLCTWSFFFPNPASPLTLTEAGVFTGATVTVNTGSMLDHWAFSPTIVVPVINTFILQVSLEFGP